MGKKLKKGPKKTVEGKTNTTLLSAPFETSHEFEGLAGFEEVSTCTLIKRSKRGGIKRELWKDGKIVKKVNFKYNQVVILYIQNYYFTSILTCQCL